MCNPLTIGDGPFRREKLIRERSLRSVPCVRFVIHQYLARFCLYIEVAFYRNGTYVALAWYLQTVSSIIRQVFAVLQALEETGYDASDKVDTTKQIAFKERDWAECRLFICQDVPTDTRFKATVKGEIEVCASSILSCRQCNKWYCFVILSFWLASLYVFVIMQFQTHRWFAIKFLSERIGSRDFGLAARFIP